MVSIEPDSLDEACPRFEDLRGAPRFSLLIRSAKLACGDEEYLCIVRDVSQTGVRLRLFHPLPGAQAMELELPAGDRYSIAPVWEHESHAGFRFTGTIDLADFVSEAGPFRKRPIRLRLAIPARLAPDIEPFPAMIRNLSQSGACIETDAALALGERVHIKAQGMPGVIAHVCWRARPAYGLALTRNFSFEELAGIAWHAQCRDMPLPLSQVV